MITHTHTKTMATLLNDEGRLTITIKHELFEDVRWVTEEP